MVEKVIVAADFVAKHVFHWFMVDSALSLFRSELVTIVLSFLSLYLSLSITIRPEIDQKNTKQ